MFTGIVEEKGIVQSLQAKGRVWRLEIAVKKVAKGTRVGQSICVNGVCLTAVSVAPVKLVFEIQKETLRCSALGSLQKGDRVNLERALSASSRLDGHFVQGHVDEMGTLRSLKPQGKDTVLEIEFSNALSPYIVPKGSITVDGVSLTVARVSDHTFSVCLIPHTLKETNLVDRKKGDKLNLEADILGKYVHWNLERQKSDRIGKKI